MTTADAKLTLDLNAIIDDFKAAGVLEDRLEYSIEDFELGHDLSTAAATALQELLHADDSHYSPF